MELKLENAVRYQINYFSDIFMGSQFFLIPERNIPERNELANNAIR